MSARIFGGVYPKQGVGVDEQRGNLSLRESGKGRIDFASGACVDDDQFVPQRIRRCLSIFGGGLGRWIARVSEETDHGRLGHKLVKQFDVLYREVAKQKAHPRDVVARSGKGSRRRQA